MVRRGREALLVPPRNPKALAGAVAWLLNDDEARAEMSRAGRERAEEFSWPRVTARVESYYNFVIRRLAASGQLPEGFQSPVPPRPAAHGLQLRAFDGGDGSRRADDIDVNPDQPAGAAAEDDPARPSPA